MNARYYSSQGGRFISQDSMFWILPMELLIDPQQQNSYSYARNNPMSMMDPGGNISISAVIGSVFNTMNRILEKLFNPSPVNAPPTPVQNNQETNKTQRTTTWDPVTDKRIAQLDPRVQQPAINFINNTETELDTQLRVVQGYRSIEEQNRLYEQGRTTPGNVVTNARGGESFHNYGLAIDVVVMENREPNWNKSITPEIANIGKREGFSWGGNWSGFKDNPHFEMGFGQTIKDLLKK